VTLGAADRHVDALADGGIARRVRGLFVGAARGGDAGREQNRDE
jgi:hypothetical protein